MKTLIKNGLIVDGSGDQPYIGDILIEKEKIVAIEKSIDCKDIDRIIDAKDLVVAPGFIDTHSHSDLVILESPYNEVKARQGITTEILGHSS